MSDEDLPVLFLRPGALVDIWVEMVVPPLSRRRSSGENSSEQVPALLPDPAGQTLSDEGPLPRPVQTDELHDLAVLLVAPGSLGQLRVQDLRPSVQTLHLGLAREEGSDLLPVLPSVDIHRLAKNNVLADQSRSQISRDSPPSRSTWSSQTCECRA